MSDGKSNSYELERIAARRAAEEERRSVLSALQTISELEARHRLFDTMLLDAQVRFNNFTLKTLPQNIKYSNQMNSSTLKSLARQYQGTLDKAETGLSKRISDLTAQEGIDAATSQLGSIDASKADPRQILQDFSSAQLTKSSKQKRTSKKQIAPLLKHIGETLPPDHSQKISELIKKYASADEHEASLIRYEISGCITNGQKQVKKFSRQKPTIINWLGKFLAKTDKEIELKTRVMKHYASCEEIPNALYIEMSEVLDAQEKVLEIEDSVEAARIVEEALVSLGYKTNSSVKAVFNQSHEEAWFQHEDWGPYYVCLRRFGNKGLSWRVVLDMSHEDAHSPDMNSMEIKDSFCNSYPDIIKALDKRGMPTQQLQKLTSSNLPVEKRFLKNAAKKAAIEIKSKKRSSRNTPKSRAK